MKPRLQFKKLQGILWFSVVFSCSNPSVSAPPNLTLVKNELKRYHDTGRYQQELTQVIQKAEQYIDYQVEINQKDKLHKKLAIVLDIDETSLSNYPLLTRCNFCLTRNQFQKEVRAANSPAIEPTLALYKDALSHGVHVFFVTGRREALRSTTQKNLINVGYDQWSGLYLRPNKYSAQSIIPFKSSVRQQISKKGYTIVATIGDQYSDLQGGYAQKGFKLPNPFYYLP